MKDLVKQLLDRAGIYYSKRPFMPYGIDWVWDIHRLADGRPVRTAFDVGANVGQTVHLIKNRFADCHVHAFEPVAATCRALERGVRDLRGVTCHRLAFAERPGQARIATGANSQLNHLLPEDAAVDGATSEIVETDTIDRFCAARQINSIDILKVDAEGADLRVLQGARQMITEGRVAFVLTEVGFVADDPGHVYFQRVYDYLVDAGAKPHGFYDYYLDDQDGSLVFANLLFASPAAIARLR